MVDIMRDLDWMSRHAYFKKMSVKPQFAELMRKVRARMSADELFDGALR